MKSKLLNWTVLISVLGLLYFFLTPQVIRCGPTREVSILTGLARWADLYARENHDVLPKSWKELESDSLRSGYANSVEIGRETLDLENRYKFPIFEKPLVMKISYQTYGTVVAMEISPGRNQGHRGFLSMFSKETQSRYVILRTPETGIVRRFPEADLEQAFKEQGLDLKDYTGSDGKWTEPTPPPEAVSFDRKGPIIPVAMVTIIGGIIGYTMIERKLRAA